MIYIDTETFSATPIKAGTYRYASSCEPMIVTYAWDNGPAKLWDVTAGEPMPADLDYLLDDPDEPITAHFAMFDRNVLRYGLKREIAIKRWRCTMAKAYAHGLPGGLDILCRILKIDAALAKRTDGRRLIHLFCKPSQLTREYFFLNLFRPIKNYMCVLHQVSSRLTRRWFGAAFSGPHSFGVRRST